ncbi:MAG TPA: cysteine hydrolase [Burkholderiales bacterium]|nr:cysteine hydrolase [Burkholderiales bacterium]
MHEVAIRPEIIHRVIARRGRLHLYERLDARRTALLVIDMQNAFVAPGAPIEVPGARDIVPTINRLSAELRKRSVPVIWVLHQNAADGRDWGPFFDVFVKPENRSQAAQALSAGHELQHLWGGLGVTPRDLQVTKNRYSALIGGASDLGSILKQRGIDTLLIAGTKTNVCCECTARDAMMLDYKVVLLCDCTAALSDDEHLATLENVIQQFGDVMTADDALALLTP